MSVKIWLLLIGFGLGLSLMAIGSYLLFADIPFDNTANAEITDAVCDDTNTCQVELKFVDATDRIYVRRAKLTYTVEKGSTITIMYDSKNPNNFYPGNPPVRIVGGILALIGLLLGFIVVGWGYFTYRSSPQARYIAPPTYPTYSVPSTPEFTGIDDDSLPTATKSES